MEVLEAIKNRRSVRSYSNKPIPAEVMARLRQALRWAPSACNYQPWRFILVTDERLKQGIVEAAHNWSWLAQAPVIVVACGFPEEAFKKMGGYGNSIDVDLAIAVDHLTLAAVAEGLGTCWIGAFDESAIKPLLNIPDEVKVVAMTPLGYPSRKDLNHPVQEGRRKPESSIFSENSF
jgi:nitroreductase